MALRTLLRTFVAAFLVAAGPASAVESGGYFPYTVYEAGGASPEAYKQSVIVIFHGFNSAIPNPTYRAFRKRFGASHTVVGFNYDYLDAARNMAELEAFQERFLTGRDVTAVGTSLGGFWADYFANRFGAARLVVVNPVVDPVATLSHFLGEQYSEKRKQKFTVNWQSLDNYRPVPRLDNPATRKLAVLMADDTLIPSTAAQKKYGDAQNATVRLYRSGGHSPDFSQHECMDAIAAFIGGGDPAPSDSGPTVQQASATATGAPDDLVPGLATRYYYSKFNHIDELLTWMDYSSGKVGPPLERLYSKVGKGDVLTSGSKDLVGAVITGFLRFDAPGLYHLRVMSNDGVRITLDGEMVFEDPEVHADRLSPPIPVSVEQAGHVPLEVLYFEKKNTSTLQLRWQPPGAEGFDPVPASAFWHQPDSGS